MVIQTYFFCVFMNATQTEPTLRWVPTSLSKIASLFFRWPILNKYTGTGGCVFEYVMWSCFLFDCALKPWGNRFPFIPTYGRYCCRYPQEQNSSVYKCITAAYIMVPYSFTINSFDTFWENTFYKYFINTNFEKAAFKPLWSACGICNAETLPSDSTLAIWFQTCFLSPCEVRLFKKLWYLTQSTSRASSTKRK